MSGETSGLAARLGPWNEQFATVGMELLGRRRKAVAALQRPAGEETARSA